MALERELSKYDDSTKIPVTTVTEILNKITGNKRLVVLPEEERGAALELLKQKMIEHKVSFPPEVGEALHRIPKDFANWWDQDDERLGMVARTYIAGVWASEKFGGSTLGIARAHPVSKIQIRKMISRIHESFFLQDLEVLPVAGLWVSGLLMNRRRQG